MKKHLVIFFNWLIKTSAPAIMLLGAAFYNAFPLVYSDTGTYIASGFDGKVPFDRPIVYGEFIRFTSLGFSLWLPVLVQSLLLASLMRRVWALFFPEKSNQFFLTCLFGLCALTALPWYAGQLMPDIFTPMLLLVMVLVLQSKNLSRFDWFWLGLIYVLSCTVHFSNLFIGLSTLLLLIIFRYFNWFSLPELTNFRKKLAILTFWSASAFLILPAINWSVEGNFTLGKGSYAFILGRMVDNGILKDYLDANCASGKYKLCAYKDSLPESSRKFHWDSNSPMHREGGWGTQEKEYRDIVFGSLRSPRFLARHIWESIVATPTQLMQNTIGSGLDYKWYRSPESPPYQSVARLFPRELNAYRFCRQNGNLWKQELNFDFLNSINFWVLLASVLVLLFCQIRFGKTLNPDLKIFLGLVLIGILSNAFITSSLAVICDRFPSRVVWLLTWVAVIYCVQIYLPNLFGRYK